MRSQPCQRVLYNNEYFKINLAENYGVKLWLILNINLQPGYTEEFV